MSHNLPKILQSSRRCDGEWKNGIKRVKVFLNQIDFNIDKVSFPNRQFTVSYLHRFKNDRLELSSLHIHTSKAHEQSYNNYSTMSQNTSKFDANVSQSLKCIKLGDWEISPFNSQPTPHSPIETRISSLLESSTIIGHIQWLLQKISMGQDMLLIGPPGALKRRLAFEVAKILNAEVEYVSITRDVNESDLKQRREITKRSAKYIDQAVVRAALEGKILILDGLERAERNLLPILNNLLENREMALEDGRLMIRSERWKELSEKNENLSDKIVAVHPNFRVIGISLPVPPFQGNPLDPPLRSRFQARQVHEEDIAALIQLPNDKIPPNEEWDHGLVSIVLQLVQSITMIDFNHQANTKKFQQLPPFTVSHTEDLITLLHTVRPILTEEAVLTWLKSFYPIEYLSKDKQVKQTLQQLFERGASEIATFLNLPPSLDEKLNATNNISNIERISESLISCTLSIDNRKQSIKIRAGVHTPRSDSRWIPNKNHSQILQNMILSHMLGRDICLIGERSSGKSLLAGEFASILGNVAVTLPCYPDMTSRDLLLSRSTDSEGNTIWKESALIKCMREGNICILESVHNLDKHVLMSIQSLIQDRELFLSDGSRWVDSKTYDTYLSIGFSEEVLKERQVYRIHPSFSIVALSVSHGQESNWFSAETLQLFHFHFIPKLSIQEEYNLISQRMDMLRSAKNVDALSVSQIPEFSTKLISLLKFKHSYNSDLVNQPSKKNRMITLREILRLAYALSERTHSISLVEAVYQMTMFHFLPIRARNQILKMMDTHGIHDNKIHEHLSLTNERYVQIGSISSPKKVNSDPALVPKPFFVDTEEHLMCMQRLLFDHIMHSQEPELGFHSLLIGNQGVGKNVLTYALLNALNVEMEYMQLHRDITVHSLTVQPSVIDGVIQYTDSPLVRAVQYGRTLLLDEADKCPLEVVSVIRSLLADGEMSLSDGRRIVRYGTDDTNSEDVIKIHPEFRVIVLANRPGYPFHGENFFGECGDLFQTQYVDNPSGVNQLKMLQSYAPNVSKHLLQKLIACFDDLRQLNIEGVIQYPYSTRELVSIAKHLQFFPKDGVTTAVGNVISFDRFNERLFQHLRIVFERHGIPLHAVSNYQVNLSTPEPLSLIPSQVIPMTESYSLGSDCVSSWQGEWKEVDSTVKSQIFSTNATNHRIASFNEHKLSISCQGLNVNQLVNLDDGSLHGWINQSPMGLVSYHPPSYGKHTIFDMTPLHFLSNIQIAAWKPENRILIFGTTYIQGVKSLLDRRTSLYFYLFDPRSMRFEGAVAFPIATKYLDKYHLISHENNVFTIWATGGTEFYVLTLEDSSVEIRTYHFGNKINDLRLISHQEYLITSGQDQMIANVGKDIRLQLLSLSNIHLHPFSRKNEHHEFTSVNSKGILTLVQVQNEKLQIFDVVNQKDQPISVVLPIESGTSIIGESLDKMCYVNVNIERRTALKLYNASKHSSETSPILSATELSVGRIATVHQDHEIRVWDVNTSALNKDASFWKSQINSSNEQLRIEFQYHNNNLNLKGPKHGKEDDKPHVGGNTYAGGTGGRDTAGLGGVGGPYRLDKGHNVYQLPDSMKKKVDKDALERARQMGKEAFKKRLEEIEMSEADLSMYQKFYENVQLQVHHLRDLLENLRAKEQDRVWVKGQTNGELDEGKVIEALTGETGIYKRRAKKEDSRGFFQQKKPKSLRFLVDVSGSMYRFNGSDKRLFRMLELVVLLMESLEGFEHKFQYEIIGHSGDSRGIPFVTFNKAPKNQKDRLKVIMRMHAHSQYCWSGDSTIEATYEAIKAASEEEESDERFVFCFSDANLARYGISPKSFGELLISEDNVKAFAVFIAGFGDEAERSVSQMPEGHAYVCKDTSQLSKVFEEIFTSHVIDE